MKAHRQRSRSGAALHARLPLLQPLAGSVNFAVRWLGGAAARPAIAGSWAGRGRNAGPALAAAVPGRVRAGQRGQVCCGPGQRGGRHLPWAEGGGCPTGSGGRVLRWCGGRIIACPAGGGEEGWPGVHAAGPAGGCLCGRAPASPVLCRALPPPPPRCGRWCPPQAAAASASGVIVCHVHPRRFRNTQ